MTENHLGKKIICSVEKITIFTSKGSFQIKARIDTGAYRTSIDKEFAEFIGVNFLEKKIKMRSASGRQERRLCKLEFELCGERIESEASISERKHMKYKAIIGRRDLKNFLVKP